MAADALVLCKHGQRKLSKENVDVACLKKRHSNVQVAGDSRDVGKSRSSRCTSEIYPVKQSLKSTAHEGRAQPRRVEANSD